MSASCVLVGAVGLRQTVRIVVHTVERFMFSREERLMLRCHAALPMRFIPSVGFLSGRSPVLICAYVGSIKYMYCNVAMLALTTAQRTCRDPETHQAHN